MLEKRDVLLIDATVIVGILVLLSVGQIGGLGNSIPQAKIVNVVNGSKAVLIEASPSPTSTKHCGLLPDYFYTPIYLVTFVIFAFAMSAAVEIGIILNSVRGYSKTGRVESLTEIKIEDPENKIKTIPKNASAISLILMGIGFLWLAVTITLFAVNEISKLHC